MLAGVTTVGCRRCGEGPAGETFASTVIEGLRVACEEEPGVIVLEGSGAALAPVAAHATLCVTAAVHARTQALSYLGPVPAAALGHAGAARRRGACEAGPA